MSRSRSRLAADWFAKLRVNSTTQAVEHDDVEVVDAATTTALSAKADTTYVDTAIGNIDMTAKADITYVDNALSSLSSSFEGLTDTTVSTADPSHLSNPANTGHLWFNKVTGEGYICSDNTLNNNIWLNVGEGSGGITPPYLVEYFLIAGGGMNSSGGMGTGGSGGGGWILGSQSMTTAGTVHTVAVGGATADSSFGTNAPAIAGGSNTGQSGGSGSGGAYYNGVGGAGTAGQGHAGGNGAHGTSHYYSGGGGGAGGVGGNVPQNVRGGLGGVGKSTTFAGTTYMHSGCGGGGGWNNPSMAAGSTAYGGGNSTTTNTNGQNGVVNTGGGAGGSGSTSGTYAFGGSGLVILKIPTVSYTGVYTGSPIITTVGSDTILKFTSSGSYTEQENIWHITQK